jgi:hypothetical protein
VRKRILEQTFRIVKPDSVIFVSLPRSRAAASRGRAQRSATPP